MYKLSVCFLLAATQVHVPHLDLVCMRSMHIKHQYAHTHAHSQSKCFSILQNVRSTTMWCLSGGRRQIKPHLASRKTREGCAARCAVGYRLCVFRTVVRVGLSSSQLSVRALSLSLCLSSLFCWLFLLFALLFFCVRVTSLCISILLVGNP